MSNHEFLTLAKSIFSDGATGYDGTACLDRVDLPKLLGFMEANPSCASRFEQRALHFIESTYQDTNQAPSWQHFQEVIVSQVNNQDPFTKQPKDSPLPTLAEATNNLTELGYYFGQTVPGVPADMPGKVKLYSDLLQRQASGERIENFLKDLRSGTSQSEAVANLIDALPTTVLTKDETHRDTFEPLGTAEQLYRDNYERRLIRRAVSTGFSKIDNVTGGFDAKELISIVGASGHGKSSLCVYYTYYTLVTGTNGVYFTLEMSEETLMNRLYAMHSRHPKFQHLGIPPISAHSIKMGTLSEAQFELLFGENGVVDDFTTLAGRLRVINISGMDLKALRSTLLLYDTPENPLSFFVIDHVGWMVPPNVKGLAPFQNTENLFKGIADICNTHKGVGIAGIMAVQANRKAFETAQKTGGGCYDIGSTALTLEVERSSSQCYGIFHDTYAQDTLSQISCYKTRNGPKPTNFLVNFDPHTGYYTEYTPKDTTFPDYEGGYNPNPSFAL